MAVRKWREIEIKNQKSMFYFMEYPDDESSEYRIIAQIVYSGYERKYMYSGRIEFNHDQANQEPVEFKYTSTNPESLKKIIEKLFDMETQ